MGRRRNELRNAVGRILKLRIIVAVQDLKISFHEQIFVPSPLLACASSLRFALATALNHMCSYFTSVTCREMGLSICFHCKFVYLRTELRLFTTHKTVVIQI